MPNKIITRFKLLSFLVLFLFGAVFSGLLQAQTPPDKFLGHRVGEDRKLADYAQIKAYFELLDKESPKLTLLNIGQTTLGKDMIMAIISDEENLRNLDRYRDIARQLKDARGLSEAQARELAKQGKTILLITCNIHSTEIAASQMAIELAYDLISGKAFFDVNQALKEVIVLLAPSINPDGQEMVTDWYRKYVGTKYEGGNMPWLYHHYAGHDNNRDFFMINLAETRAVTKVLYHDWFPQIHIDEHQMGSTGARIFVPPFMDPPLPNVQPLLWRSVNLCGVNMAYDLQKFGYKGVVNGRSYTGWWIGACDDTSWLHNVVGLLSEAASVRIASPIYIEPTEVPKSYYEKRMDFIDPWPGGWWRLRDIVDYELTISKSLVKTAWLNKEDFLFNSYLMGKQSIEVKERNQPYAFVITKDQLDYPTTLKMIEILQLGGVEVHQATKDFIADGRYYPAGSFVILMAQPYKAYAWALLEKQKYPDLRQYPGGPPIPPYDNAGWTLPLQMGVKCDQIDKAFEVPLNKVDKVEYPKTELPDEAGYLVLDPRPNASYAVAFELLKNKAQVWRAKTEIKTEASEIPAGAFLVKNSAEVKKILSNMLQKWPVPVTVMSDVSPIEKAPVSFPRIAIYQSWRGNADEGWTRYMLDDLGLTYSILHNKDFKGDKGKKVNLKANYDVIIFASEGADIIKSGRPAQRSEFARYFAAMPPEYEGGIEKEGIDALKAFVENGGRLITLNQASELAMSELGVPARNALSGIDRNKFFCPTSILRIKVDNTTPLGYGFEEETGAVFSRSLAFSTWVPPVDWDRKVVAYYPEDNILLSGWLLGEEYLARNAAVVDIKNKKGHIFLIGIRAQHRAQSHGTYKFLLNAFFYPEEM
ncbi:MAG: M14 family metallopeptidase [Acidobacteriota bacterium]|nr:M14 family metallopeptidase [Acidobacteriota bacterium]MDW3228713.1 M14 family metallopeptidase [Acidobacteriota bacterium]